MRTNEDIFRLLQNKLVHEEHYEYFDAAFLTANIMTSFQESIKNAIIDWADGKDVSKYELNETTVAEVAEVYSCSIFKALCFMNPLKLDVDIYNAALLRREWSDPR